MPDEVLNLTVAVNQMPIQQLRESMKELKATMMQMNPNSQEFKDASATYSQMSVRIKDLNYQMSGLSGAVKAGRMEHRMFRFAIMEVMGGVTGLTSAIDNITGDSSKGLKAFTGALQGSFGAAMGVKFGLDMLGGAAKAISGPAAIAMGAFVLLSQGAKELTENEKRLNEALDKQTELLVKLGQADGATIATKKLLEAQAALTAAQGERANAPFFGGIWAWFTGGPSAEMGAAGTDWAANVIEGTDKVLEAQLRLNAALKEELKNRTDAIIAIENTWEPTQAELDLEKEIRDTTKEWLAYKKYSEEARLRGEMTYIAGQFSQRWLGREPKPGEVMGMPMAPGVGEPINFADTYLQGVGKMEMITVTFLDHMRQGFLQSTNVLGQGFAKAFGLGQSLLDKMLETMLGSIAQAGFQTLLSFIPGIGPLLAGEYMHIKTGAMGMVIPEPVFGIGKSGRGYLMGEAGPEYVGPINHIGQEARMGGGGMMQPFVQVFPIESNSGLAVRVEVGNRENARRRIG